MESWPHARASPIHPSITVQAIYFITFHKKLWQYPEVTDESKGEGTQGQLPQLPTPLNWLS